MRRPLFLSLALWRLAELAADVVRFRPQTVELQLALLRARRHR
jgi:hypothetical protein